MQCQDRVHQELIILIQVACHVAGVAARREHRRSRGSQRRFRGRGFQLQVGHLDSDVSCNVVFALGPRPTHRCSSQDCHAPFGLAILPQDMSKRSGRSDEARIVLYCVYLDFHPVNHP